MNEKQLEFDWVAEKSAPVTPKTSQPDSQQEDANLERETLALMRFLGEETGLNIDLRLSRGKTTMITMKPNHNRTAYQLRLHPMFITAPSEIHQLLAAWLQNPNQPIHQKKLQQYIKANRPELAALPPDRTKLQTRGTFYDLKTLSDEVNLSCFNNQLDVSITWGQMPKKTRRRSIRFGSYSPHENLVRIHPLLDQQFVPEYFIRYIIFHEMLHAFVGIKHGKNGRRVIHSKKFLTIEQQYVDFERANAWMSDSKNLCKLLHTL